ncbi:GIY-YIG nuclease family protein [Bradyrhizobium sp.]|uniref:GIY-YIG nuclease family protein n=1 Tax=Bradyrhizobium sp. TaxID=376 RepID=UPI001EB6DB03|nr:GIY-YIG nuclease family protein [Bradyrhizobium sp.]MBV8917662.1 GIY-YIG nuclease family protein [Bradyrhizobium sp.]MBV9985932.1 GIY-YIG nuclease family protein [Bradyrhizobium sp.]
MAGLVPAIHVLQYLGMARGYIYILTNRPNGILYVGATNDLVRRVFEHRSGSVEGFTKRYGLKRLVYFEQFDTITDAIQREKNIKHWSRAWKVRLIVAGNPNWDDLYDTITGQDVDGRDKPGHDEC